MKHMFLDMFSIYFKSDERTTIENMRATYHDQLRRHLDPDSISIQSKAKSIAANSQQGAGIRSNGVSKVKQDLFRSQRLLDAHGSFDSSPFTQFE
jgi:hypothetical protein